MKRRGRRSVDSQLAELRERIEDIGMCPTQVLLLEEAIALADSANDVETGFELRQELIKAANFTGSPEKVLVAFAWNLAQVDRDPNRFAESDLLWEYKWVISTLDEFPQISIGQMEAATADLERRFQRHGASLRPVHTLRCKMHKALGNAAQVRELLPAWKKAGRGYLSDCAACDRNSLATMHAFLKQDRRVLQYAEPLLEFKMQCAEVPQATFAHVLLPLLRLQRPEEAQRLHQQGYPLVKGKPSFLDTISEHMIFLVLMSEQKTAIKVFEQHTRLALETRSPARRFEFLRAVLFLFLQLLKAPQQHKRFRLPETFPLWKENGLYDLAEVANWIEGEARSIAKQFDERNRNSHRTEELDELEELAELIRK